MSGWTTFTVELRGEDEYYEETGGFIGEDSADVIHEWGEKTGVQVFTAKSMASNWDEEIRDNIGYLVVTLGGYREWSENVDAFIEAMFEFSTGRVVITKANDTSDTGVARLYEFEDEETWEIVDQYKESQEEDGTHVGMKAAAYMHVNYGIPAVSKTRPTYEHSEGDSYTDGTALARPR